jgi:Protein of unknown function (DUF2793)
VANTTKLQLPLLTSNQSQKDVTVNQALTQVDALVQLSVISRTVATPPATPSNEDSYIVPSGATGVWVGQTNNVATYYASTGGWIFLPPSTGWLVWSQGDTSFVAFYGGAWQTVAILTAIKGRFTLTASATSTTVAAPGCVATSVVMTTAYTADGAQDATDLYIVPGVNQFVANHASNSRIDRTFNYVLYI